MLYEELKNEMLKGLLIEVTDETSYRVHQATFGFGLSNGLSNQESYWLANDIINITKGKSLEEVRQLVEEHNMPETKNIEYKMSDSGKQKLILTKGSQRLLFYKILEYIRDNDFFEIYDSVDVGYGHYESTEIEFHFNESQFYNGNCYADIDFNKANEEIKRLKKFIEDLGIKINEEKHWSDWTIDEDWGETTYYTTFIV